MTDEISPIAYGSRIDTILLLKLDHIGDFFISTPAMRRIRDAFPAACITLVCGPWNKPLAAAMGIFDIILPFSFFHEQSRSKRSTDNDPRRIVRTHREFAKLAQGSYDLAVDLRYDCDTRRLLTMVDARYRVGIGDTGEFPFLDIAIASDRPQRRPDQPEGEVRRFEVDFDEDGDPVRLDGGRRDLKLRFEIDMPTSPMDLGLGGDERLLGIALSRLKVVRGLYGMAGLFSEHHPVWNDEVQCLSKKTCRIGETVRLDDGDDWPLRLGAGFATPEPFGVWTEAGSAEFEVPLVSGVNADLQLCMLLEGHVAPRHPLQSFQLWCDDERIARATITAESPRRTLIVPIDRHPDTSAGSWEKSQRFEVGLGKAMLRVALRPLGDPDLTGSSWVRLEVVNSVGRVLAKQTFSGAGLGLLGANEIAIVQDDPDSLLHVRVITGGTPFQVGIDLLRVNVTTVLRKYTPSLHVVDWGNLIAQTIVGRFASPADLLTLPDAAISGDLASVFDNDRQAGRKIVVIAVGANKDVTKWPLDYFRQLTELLLASLPCTVYLIGAAREYAEAQQLIMSLLDGSRVINLCGATSLMQLGNLFKSADLFIGNSTGTTHAAAMSGTRTLALLSAANHPNQWAPLGARASFLSLDVPCRQCHILFLSECGNGFRCMMEMTPDLVFARAAAILTDEA